MANKEDWQHFLKYGYVLEALLRHFHEGEDAYIMSKFISQERFRSDHFFQEILMIEDIMEEGLAAPTDVSSDYQIRMARREDIPGLLQLYGQIFETYPSPLNERDYLETVFQKDYLYVVAEKDNQVVAAASAELFQKKRAAELTDCATEPGSRGKGLMAGILRKLQGELLSRGYICAYTMARARSFGMNRVFYQMGFSFTGRLVNNCDIFGDLEDMNIWVKKLQ